MKYYLWLFMAFIVFSANANANAARARIEIVERFDDYRVIAFIEQRDIDRSPEWKPSVAAPPLTLVEAIRAVKEYVGKSDALGDVKEIEIRPVPNNPSKWHYLIKIADEKMKAGYDIFVVLMNGKVAPAMIEPQSYK